MIRARSLVKRHGDLEVLKGLDFEVKKGEVAAVIGPSGGEKSTFLRCLNGLEMFQGGEVTVGEHVLTSATDPRRDAALLQKVRRQVGFVFQQFNLFPHLTALDNVALPLRKVYGRSKQVSREIAAVALRRVGLIERAGHYPAELSGGQQQRVAIARALALDPEVLLFDEPTSALDPELVGEVLKTMREVAETGMTMVIVTHELGFAKEIGDLNVFMEEGRIVESGPRGFYENCKSDRAREFLRAVM